MSLISSPPSSPSSSGKVMLRPHVLAAVNQLGAWTQKGYPAGRG